MITDRNKFNFVTICIGLSFLLTNASVVSTQVQSNAQQETNQQQQEQAIQSQPTIAAISVVQNKDESTNAIVNEQANGVVHTFSPRLDYSNEWRPLGRGDPLKNDPTFDYSPPTLEHVRYWAETSKDSSKEESGSSKQDGNSGRFAHLSKKDTLLLGMPNEHLRGSAGAHAPQSLHQQAHLGQHALPPHQHQQPYHQPHPGIMKNAKGETPLLQPKYTSVRRSYYAQQLPTRLMPPPMQVNSPPLNTFNVPMKPSQAAQVVHTEYRHSMPAMAPNVSTMPSKTNVSHMKPATQNHPSMSTPSSAATWMYSSPPATMQHHHYVMSSGAAQFMSTSSQPTRMPQVSHAYDSHPQDSHHYFSYTRPSPNGVGSHPSQESLSPNSLRQSGSSHKQNGTGRKPWLHELLQKEVVKTSAKPGYSAAPSKLAYETTKPIYERVPFTNSIGSGFSPVTPVTFVSAPPTVATAATMPTTTTTTTTTTRSPLPPSISITPSVFYPTISTTTARPISSTTARVIYTTPTAASTTPRTSSSTTMTRLLIPTTSNLAHRPTVAPMQMTTDSLFSHYKQPEAPLRGPMYLIIEGHSKVKKYGKNGINLNLPKIVPVIPKREPVVRIAEPGEENRGTPETFQVEHLHVKTLTSIPSTTTTTSTVKPAMAPKPATTVKPMTTTTPTSTTKSTTISKPAPIVTNSIKEETQKPLIASTTTTARPGTTTAAPRSATTTAAAAKATTKLTMKAASKPESVAAAKPVKNEPLIKLELPNDPPTGMQGLLSLLDSSLSGLFAEQPLDLPPAAAQLNETNQPAKAQIFVTTPSTVLQPVKSTVSTTLSALPPVNTDARVGSSSNRIVSAAAAATGVNQSGSAEFSYTTDVPPREVRQVYDYDHRPESRLKDFVIESIDGEGDEGTSAFYEDEEFEEYDEDDGDADIGSQQSNKRIDKFVDVDFGGGEGEFVGDYENVALEELGLGDAVPVGKTAAATATTSIKTA